MGGMGEEEIVIMYHYIEDKVFLKDMKYLCSNIINQLVQLINNDSLILGAGLRLLRFCFLKRIIARAVSVSVTAIQFSMYIPQASLYSARQEHRKRCPCLFG